MMPTLPGSASGASSAVMPTPGPVTGTRSGRDAQLLGACGELALVGDLVGGALLQGRNVLAQTVEVGVARVEPILAVVDLVDELGPLGLGARALLLGTQQRSRPT